MARIFSSPRMALCIAVFLACPLSAQAQATGAPIKITAANPAATVDMVPLPPSLGPDTPDPTIPPPGQMPMDGIALDDMGTNAPLPSAAPLAPPQSNALTVAFDPIALCRAENPHDSYIHDCLRKMRVDLQAKMEDLQLATLQNAPVDTDWKKSRLQAQMMVNSAMSFDLYRTAECMRRHNGQPWDQNPDTNDYVACEVQLTQARIDSLQP